MTPPIESPAPAPSVGYEAKSAGAPAPKPTSAPAPDPVAQHRPEPIALDVARGEDGVFVYTLSDPSTGRLVAVIPDTQSARTAGNYASGGWVSLTA